MKKTIEIGKIKREGRNYRCILTIKIRNEENDKPTLSITGEITRYKRVICCGQIDNEIEQYYNDGSLNLFIKAEQLEKLLQIWRRWHLNDLRPYCEHQWKLIPYYENELGKTFFDANNYGHIIKLPDFKWCSRCGYTYGTKWLYEPLPKEVIKFLEEL